MSEPWVEKYRPQTLDDICLDDAPLKQFRGYIETGSIPNHLLFVGGAGLGKTTLAKILAKTLTNDEYLYVAASKNGGIDMLRNEISSFCSFLSSTKKIVVLDEADGLSPMAQQGLRNTLDEFASTATFILTANYKTKIIDPIHSRCQIYDFQNTDKKLIAKRCLTILKGENIVFSDKEGLKSLINKTYPDIRRIVMALQKSSLTGTFIYDTSITSNTEDSNNLISWIKDGNIKEISRELLGSGCDFISLYRTIFNRSEELCTSHVKLRLITAEYMYRHSTVPDQDINFKACLLALYQVINSDGKPSFM